MAMTFKERVEYLISALRVQDPGLDTTDPSPIRVLINAVAEMGAQADVAYDKSLEWDVSKKSGRDLDNFVELFGFTRLPAKYASGFVTLGFGLNTTRDYILPKGTIFQSVRRGGGIFNTYVSTETIGIPRYTANINVPIRAEFPGALYNARAGEVRVLNYDLEQLSKVLNEKPIIGGKREESDEELRDRFRAQLFRNNLGNESWYKSIADRHTNVSSTQIIKPSQETEEHLKIVNSKVQCMEDSLIFTYPNTFSIYLPRTQTWLEEVKDFIVIIDNETPAPPVIEFIGNAHQEGDSVTVRYRYCSSKSRNNPRTNYMHYLDIYVMGQQPTYYLDFAQWPSDQTFGVGSINEVTHPDGLIGLPYHVFTRQPVVEVPTEVVVRGRNYLLNRDYVMVKDRSINADSTRAKDILLWKTNLPFSGEGVPAFRFPYFHEAVVSDIQTIIDAPDMHTAVDDVLVHAATRIPFNVNLTIEWERGIEDQQGLREVIEEHFMTIPMGSRIRIGPFIRAISQMNRVAAVFLGEGGISSPVTIRGKNAWKYDVPLPDGSIPILDQLTVTSTASNLY
jgi:hypothetical protein